jgi:segregation and condensation protein B
MAKNKNKTSADDMVNFVPGSSVIDIGELRRAQSNYDEDLSKQIDAEDAAALTEGSDDELEAKAPGEDESELSLDEQADLLRAELASDPELKKDVLADFDNNESNDDLARMADGVHEQELKNLHEMEILAGEVSDELRALNEVFIAEDKLLEGKMAQETLEEAAKMASSRNGKKTKKVKTEALPDLEDEDTIEEMSEEDQELLNALPTADENGEYNVDDLQSCIEALLFYSDRSVSFKRLKEMLEMTEADDAPLLQAIEQLKAVYQTASHGFEVAEIAGGYQLRTKPSKAPLLRKLAKVQVQRLSRGAMESLTIVAYKQPCTKDEIDKVRGVDSSHFIRTLLDRHLIEVSGRSEAAGRPMIYNTTDTFLEVFGLMDLKGMPPLHEIEAMVPQMAAASAGEEDPRVIQMRNMVHQMKIEANHLDYNAKEDEEILAEIRDRVKAIDITTPYLARQKALAEEGILGDEADLLLAKEFGFAREDLAASEDIAIEEHADRVQPVHQDPEHVNEMSEHLAHDHTHGIHDHAKLRQNEMNFSAGEEEAERAAFEAAFQAQKQDSADSSLDEDHEV